MMNIYPLNCLPLSLAIIVFMLFDNVLGRPSVTEENYMIQCRSGGHCDRRWNYCNPHSDQCESCQRLCHAELIRQSEKKRNDCKQQCAVYLEHTAQSSVRPSAPMCLGTLIDANTLTVSCKSGGVDAAIIVLLVTIILLISGFGSFYAVEKKKWLKLQKMAHHCIHCSEGTERIVNITGRSDEYQHSANSANLPEPNTVRLGMKDNNLSSQLTQASSRPSTLQTSTQTEMTLLFSKSDDELAQIPGKWTLMERSENSTRIHHESNTDKQSLPDKWQLDNVERTPLLAEVNGKERDYENNLCKSENIKEMIVKESTDVSEETSLKIV